MGNKRFKPARHRPFFKLVRQLVKCFKKRPIIINKNGHFPQQAMFISNHSGASGPFVMGLFFPVFYVPWGAHQMTEGYRQRWGYLYYVFYQQKLGYNRFKSFLLASTFALFSKGIYKGMNLIPTYEDIRLVKTFHQSERQLLHDRPILVYPEDSNQGYHEVLEKFNPGFASFVVYYNRKYKTDLPVYPIYYDKNTNMMIIDEPHFVQTLVEQGMNRMQIASYFKDVTNVLGRELAGYQKHKR